MAKNVNGVWSADAASRTLERKDRWPIPRTTLLVTASSLALWALIIGGVRWLIM